MERFLLLLLIARFHRIYLSFGRYVCRFQGGKKKLRFSDERKGGIIEIYIYISDERTER